MLNRRPTEAKKQKEKEETIAQPKYRFKRTGPFAVLDATSDTLTIMQDGLPMSLAIERCAKAPPQMDPEQEEDQEQQRPNLAENR